MLTPGNLAPVLDEMRSNANMAWGDLGTVDVRTGPLAKLVAAFLDPAMPSGRRMLCWLLLHAAWRSLAVWEYYCDGTIPHQVVQAMRKWLDDGTKPPDLRWLTTPAEPAYHGYRLGDRPLTYAGMVAEGVAYAARFLADGHAEDALDALIRFDNAIDLAMSGDDFHAWLVEVAVPAAIEERDLTAAERSAHRNFDAEAVPAWRDQRAAKGYLLYDLPR